LGCRGGYIDYAFEYAKKKFIVDEKAYPYEG
jgi:hypothetical protein